MAKKIDIEKKAPAHYAEVNAIQERMGNRNEPNNHKKCHTM